MIKLTNMLEFKGDLKKQCVVLMGLPASGKTTFIKDELNKYVSAPSYKVTNSDIQVKSGQFHLANSHFDWLLKNVKNKSDIDNFIDDTKYKSNDGDIIKHPITYAKWLFEKNSGIKSFFRKYYKSYYATYFDIRDMALSKESDLFKTKIHQAGNLLVIDTVASKPPKIIKRMEMTKKEDFNNTIIYLDIDANLCIERDEYRKKKEGRSVGSGVILNYEKNMDNAYNEYLKYGNTKSSSLDRLLHFVWKPQGNSPIKGTWIKKSDKRFSIK